MDPKRSATEMGNKLQSGEEPLSGEQGKGTAEQPFDQGNAEGSEGRSAEEKPSVGLEEMKKAVTGATASVMGKES